MANFEPLGPRKWPRNDCNDLQAASILQTSNNETITKAPVIGACSKCGYPGHLAYQCRNTIPLSSIKKVVDLDISSTSSESEYETPLKSVKENHKEKKREKKLLKKLNKEKKKKRKRRRSNSSLSVLTLSSSSDEERSCKRSKKAKKYKNSDKFKHKKQCC